MLVYNLNENAEGLVEGVCYYNGSRWVALNAEPSNDKPAPIAFLRQPGFVWLGANGELQTDLAIQVAQIIGANLQYQWYSRDPVTFVSTPLTGENGPTLSLAKNTHGINMNGKVYQFYCVVINGSQYGISETGYVVFGIGARLANNGWLRFAPANLWAEQSYTLAQQMAYQPTANYDPTVYGDWYQWGRKKDGHQLRTTPANQTNAVYLNTINGVGLDSLDTSGQIKEELTAVKSQFILRNAGTNDWRQYPGDGNTDVSPANAWTWGTPVNGIADSDPCRSELGASWRVPTQAEWAQIASNNTWVWQDGGPTGISGYQLKPGGTTRPTALFLPATGSRSRKDGAALNVGPNGNYWSSTTTSTSSYSLSFSRESINSGYANYRANGLTVRCVTD
jgi:uncharacterized protein (TIGR02145 family)